MAFSNTYSTTNPGSAVSNREDLTDVLTVLAPEETPITSLAKKSKATATYNEWTVDSLAAPVIAGVREGQDISTFVDKFSGRARLGNYIQLFQKNYMVSQLQDAVESVGPAKIAEAEAKAIREMKRDIEATVAGTQDRAVEDGSATAYALRGIGDWLDSAGPADVPSDYRTPAASIHATGTLTESSFNGLVASIFNKTGTVDALTLVAGTTLRRA